MDTYLWRYTYPGDGRVTTKDHFTGAEALRIFRDAERVEGYQAVADDAEHVGWGLASGMVWLEDGAMMQDGGRQFEMPGS